MDLAIEAESQLYAPAFVLLSPLQRAYLFGGEGHADLFVVPHYYIEFCVQSLPDGRIEQTLAALARRHDLLRSELVGGDALRIGRHPAAGRVLFEPADWSAAGPAGAQVWLERARREMARADMPPQRCVHLRAIRLPSGTLRLLFNFNLVYFDGLAVNAFLREFYSLCRDPGAALPALLPLAQFCQDDAPTLQSRERAQQYWDHKAGSLPPPPLLPQKAAAGAHRSQLSRRKLRIGASQWAGLRRSCGQHGVFLNTVLLTAYATVIAAWSKAPQFSLTMLVQQPRTQAVTLEQRPLGNFGSMLIVGFDFSRPATLLERAQRAQPDLFMDMAHASVCGVQVLHAWNRQRGVNLQSVSPPSFVTMLSTAAGDETELLAIEGASMIGAALETPGVLLDHQVIETPDGGAILNWDCDQDRFETGVAADMFDAMKRLIVQLCDDPGLAGLSAQQLLPAAQAGRRQTPFQAGPLGAGKLLQQLFHDQVVLAPRQPALLVGELCLDYQTLFHSANALAARLVASGVRRGDRVAILMDKGWEQVLAALAVVSAGAAYVPINADTPRQRVELLVHTCTIRVLLCQAGTAGRHAIVGVQALEVGAQDITTSAIVPPLVEGAASDLAYVIFTSGSTGVPKGVALDHAGPVNTILDINRRFGIGRGDRVLGVSSFSFDLSVYDVFGTLAAGATLVLLESDRAGQAAHWLDMMDRHAVSVWNSAPPLMSLLIQYAESAARRLPASLRLAMLSGDWIPVALPGQIDALCSGHVRTISLGGATEASIWSIWHEAEPADAQRPSIPYGAPLCSQSVYVLDEQMNLRPDWVTGKLYIGGIGLAQCYWGDPEKTTRSFVRHPRTGERLYATGDLGRYLDNGEIEFLGREDNQVKIAGYRIELGEIENLLLRHPQVEGAVLRAIGDGPARRFLAAYIVARSPALVAPALTADAVSQFLAEHLPRYMIPSAIVFLPAFPLSANGKIDRNLLPLPVQLQASDGGNVALPADDTEAAIAVIWRDLLGLETVPIEQDFFSLGGQSFLAVQMLMHLQTRLRMEVSVADFLQTPTVRELARHVRSRRRSGASAARRTGPLVALREDPRHRTALVLAHPSGGNVYCYRALARALDAPVDVYALQHADIAGFPAIVDKARHYMDAVVAQLAGRPLILGGWSMGGTIAHEMLRLAAPSQVAGLVLIDAPAAYRRMAPDAATVRAWFIEEFLGGQGIDAALPAMRSALRALARYSDEQAFAQAIALAGAQDRADSTGLAQLHAVFASHIRALSRHRLTPAGPDAPTALSIKAGRLLPLLRRHRHAGRDCWGWSDALGQVQVRVFPDLDHYSVVDADRAPGVAVAIAQFIGQLDLASACEKGSAA